MSQYPPQGQQYPPNQPPWQRQPSPSLPPSPSSGQWQPPTTGYPSAPQFQGQWKQPGMFLPPQPQQQQQPPMQPGMFPPPQQPQQQHPPMQPGMFPPPQQQRQQPPKKKARFGLWIVLGGIAVLLLVSGGIVAALSNSAKPDTSIGATQVATVGATQVPPTAIVQSQTTASANHHFKVGQVVKVNGTWQVTINSVKSMNGDTFSTPTAGNTYFIVDVTLKNLSSQVQNVSSALNFSLQDATGQKYTETILIGETPPDGKVEASALLHGQLTYEVPTTQTSFTFNFEPDLVAGGLTVWDLQK